MSKEYITNVFETQFHKKSSRQFFTPGRINLIGEHIDYSGGNVLPCAITFGTYAAVSLREDRLIRLYSDNFAEIGILEFDIDSLEYREEDDWTNYVKGVIHVMALAGHNMNSGLDIAYFGNIPNGSGLSSSASLEVLTAFILREINHFDLDMINLVKFSQQAENEFVGVNCGIMDQFSVGMGKKDTAMYLNTSTLEFDYVPVVLGEYSIVIMNTNKKRGLVDSAYNKRREEGDQARSILQGVEFKENLCDFDYEFLMKHKDLFEDDIIFKRARHSISENERVLKANQVLKQNDIVSFGQLMNESHSSLRDDYEVTGVELDTIVEAAWNQEGVLGARVTGAGFGGCAIAIVQNDQIDAFTEAVSQSYSDKIGYKADFYVASIGTGSIEL